MPISDIRMIVTDMDGTFLGSGSTLIPENCAALREAEERGIRIAFASGRMPCVLSTIARNAGLKECSVIGLNGAHTADSLFGETRDFFPLSEETADHIADLLEKLDLRCNLYTDRGVYTDRIFSPEREERFLRAFMNSGCIVKTGSGALREAERDIPVKFLVHGEECPDAMKKLADALRGIQGITLTTAKAGTLEIMSSMTNKGIAVRRLADRYGIPAGAIMAMGDYDNDVCMLSAAGYPVAMGNASPGLLKIAGYRTLACTDAGAAHAVRMALDGRLEELRQGVF